MDDFTQARLETPFNERAEMAENPAARDLFMLMHEKKTNLALAADFYGIQKLLGVIDAIGPEIALLKTHMDLMDYGLRNEKGELTGEVMPFDEAISALEQAAEDHNFMIFEDRKFVDIGGVVKRQYTGGHFRIVEWAHFVNAYGLAGPGTIKGLREGADEYLAKHPDEVRGLIMLPYMTPEGNLTTHEFAQGTMDMGLKHPEFVMGWIGTGNPVEKLQHEMQVSPLGIITATPGCKLPANEVVENERLGQVYTDPKFLVENGADVMIVGSGIYKKETPADQVAAAQIYRNAGQEALARRVAEVA